MESACPIDPVSTLLAKPIEELGRYFSVSEWRLSVEPSHSNKIGFGRSAECQGVCVSVPYLRHGSDLHAAQWHVPIFSLSRLDSLVGEDTVSGLP